MLQPLDVCLKKPFKDRVKQKLMAWMAKGIHELTTGGRQKKTPKELMSVDQRSVVCHSKRNGCEFVS